MLGTTKPCWKVVDRLCHCFDTFQFLQVLNAAINNITPSEITAVGHLGRWSSTGNMQKKVPPSSENITDSKITPRIYVLLTWMLIEVLIWFRHPKLINHAKLRSQQCYQCCGLSWGFRIIFICFYHLILLRWGTSHLKALATYYANFQTWS